jgi:putative membrane protein
MKQPGFMTKHLPHALLAAYALIFGICAISPYDRAVWWAENIPILLLVAVLAWVHRHHRFTPTSYLFMSVLIVLHTIGGHYTFERVPFGLVTELFDFQRNHYDRLAHFSVGFYAYPIGELLLSKKLVRSSTVLLLFPVFAIFTVAGGYEIFEWIYALTAEADAGIAVLGAQGDVWDAQKDILADGLGSLFAIGVFWWVNPTCRRVA